MNLTESELSFDSDMSEPISLNNLIGKNVIEREIKKEDKNTIYFIILVFILLCIPFIIKIFNKKT